MMNTFRRYGAGVAIVAILAISGSLMSSKSAVAQATKDVVVTPLPLPVTINGNSSASGIWTRNVNDGVEPVQARVNLSVPQGSHGQGDALYNVPANRRLVMEYASAFCAIPAGQAITLQFQTTSAGTSPIHALQSSFPATFGAFASTAVGQPVRLYADPATKVTGFIDRTDTSGTANCVIQFSGYLAPLP